jgi:hypothetical protein
MISDEEIKVWRQTPASPLAHTADAVTAQGVSIVLQKYAGNPNVDQSKIIQRDIENTVGAELAQEFFIPVADQTITAEAKRMQLIESNTMLTAGIEVPVSPRDNHLIHGQTVQELLTSFAAPVLSQPNPPPQILKAAELNLNHLLAHLQIGSAMGLMKDPNFRELEKFALGFKKQLAEVVQINEQMQAAQQVVMDTIRREGLPPEATAPTPPLPEQIPVAPGIPSTPTGEAPAVANVPA